MKFGIFIVLIFLLLFELLIGADAFDWETIPFLIYNAVVLLTVFGIYKTKPDE